jgi:hypothetical protein
MEMAEKRGRLPVDSQVYNANVPRQSSVRRCVMRRLGIVAIGLALVAACTGGGGSSVRQQEARSYTESLCTDELVDWYVLGAELAVSENQPETLDELINAFNLIQDEANRFYNHVASVDPPEAMKEWHTNVLAGLQDARSIGRDLEAAVASGNENELAAVGERAERLLATFDSLSEMDVPAEYVEAWEEYCFPKIKARVPEAELD